MLVRESLGFERTGNVKSSLGIGYEGVIRNFFRNLNIPDGDYTVEPNKEIIFKNYLNLRNSNITWLPNNLTINRSLDLRNTPITKLPDNLTVKMSLNLNNTKITELPDNLTVGWSLYLNNTKITELPDNLTVGDSISVNSLQTELIDFIKNSKFKNKI